MNGEQRGDGPVRTWMSDDAAERWRAGAAARNARLAAATELVFDLARLAPGMRVLDVGTGTGDTAIMAAQRVGPTGAVLATDVAAEMLEVCAAAARDLGLANVAVRAMDAAALDVPEASFDAVISRHALQFVPDRAAALRGMRRALRPGGWLALSVVGVASRNPSWAVPFAVLDRVAGRRGSVRRPPMLWDAEPEALAEGLRAAGFADVELRALTGTVPYASAADAVRTLSEMPTALREELNGLAPGTRAQVLATVDDDFGRFAVPGGGVELPNEVLVAAGVRPQEDR